MTLEKAKLKWKTLVPPKQDEIECQFNPATLTISKGVNWEGESSPSFNAPYLKFKGGNSATYNLSLYFDSYSEKSPVDVREHTNKLLALTMRGAGYSMFLVPFSSPPSVTFVWGKITLFSAVVESVQITYTMFAQDGTPIRAKADVSLKQNDFWDDIIPAQNPTSRSDSRKTRLVHSQQRLDQIAYEEYGDSRYWRLLAESNGMDDPFSLLDGQLLVIPQDLGKE
jgi:nucleoid-associated protein YgaU